MDHPPPYLLGSSPPVAAGEEVQIPHWSDVGEFDPRLGEQIADHERVKLNAHHSVTWRKGEKRYKEKGKKRKRKKRWKRK